MNSIEHFSTLLGCHSLLSWREMLLRMGSELGYSQLLFAIIPNRQTEVRQGNAFICTSYSPQWLEWYSQNQMEQVDPIVAHCINHTTPLIWSPELYVSQPQKTMYQESRRYGMNSGVSMPMHGAKGERGVFSLVTEAESDEKLLHKIQHDLPDLLVFRDFALDSANRFIQEEGGNQPIPQLTQRELECLKWCAAGKTSWEIGHILGCSEAVVNFHISNVRRKFNVTSRRHAVAKAIQLGLINSL